MKYVVEFTSDGRICVAADCFGYDDFDRTWQFYEELCEVEEQGGSQEDFDVVFADHGCGPVSKGVIYDIDFQGFDIQEHPDGRKTIVINGIEYEIVNTAYTPEATSSFFPAGFGFEW